MKPARTEFRPLLLAALTLFAFSTSPVAFADRGGSGVRGGGTVIDVNSTPYLMDLVTKTACIFKSGADLVDENPELAGVLAQVDSLDWYFGFEIRRELAFLSYCFTGPLYRIPDSGATNGVIPQPVESTVRQGAYRLNEKVYVDTAIYNAMNAHNRAFLVLHEMLHSYLPMDLLDRKVMLRSLVKAFERVENGEIRTRKALDFQLLSAGVAFPRNTDLLDHYKKQILFLLADQDTQVDQVLAEPDPESLIRVNSELLAKNLATWDADVLAKTPPQTILEGVLTRALIDSDGPQFNTLIAKTYRNIDLIGLAFANLPEIDRGNQDTLFSSNAFRNFLATGFDSPKRATVTAGTYRILASPELVRLTAEGQGPMNAEELPLTDLHGVNAVPSDLAWLVNSIAYLIENDRMDQVVSQITENPDFYSALGLKNAKQTLAATAAPIAREKALAVEVLKDIDQKLIQSVLDGVSAVVTAPEYLEFESKVHRDRF